MEDEHSESRPVIDWLILVYDETAEKRFPLKRKWYRFDYSKATSTEIAEVIRLTRSPNSATCGEVATHGETSEVVASRASDRQHHIVRYRHLFVPVDENNVSNEIQANGFTTVSFPPDEYYEDENEQPISTMEMHDREARREKGENTYAIVLDHPETILRLGPVTPIRTELWTDKDADLFAQFFSIYRFLAKSRWLRSPCKVSSSTTGVVSAILPLHEDCMSVILPFRQLYSKKDDLFNLACNLHNRNCPPNNPCHMWVKYYKDNFNCFLNAERTEPFVQTVISAQRYIEAFAYGAGMIHKRSDNQKPESDLLLLLHGNDKEKVVFGYHYILQTLLSFVSLATAVMQQNVQHWIQKLGWAKSKRLLAEDLFRSTRNG